MDCRHAQDFILAERDGVLSADQHAVLAAHLTDCPACARQRAALAAAMEVVQNDLTAAPLPDRDNAWQELRVRLRAPAARDARRRSSPLLWLGAPLTAAAAIALLLFRPAPPVAVSSPEVTAADSGAATASASADYVELSDARATPMVYVDTDSGWLVVWAVSDAPTGGKG